MILVVVVVVVVGPSSSLICWRRSLTWDMRTLGPAGVVRWNRSSTSITGEEREERREEEKRREGESMDDKCIGL